MTVSIQNKTYKLEVINSYDLLQEKIFIPECQRNISNEHVDEIYEFQKKHHEKYGEFFFTNSIIICTLDDKKYIVDGHHRYECIKKLYNENHSYNFNVYITTIYVENMKELEEKYIAINKNIPVQIFGDIEVWKSFYKKIENFINEHYKKYVSQSENPKIPNFNTGHLIQYLDDNCISKKLHNNYELFITEFDKLNNYYKENIDLLKINFKNKIDTYIHKSKQKQENYLLLSLFKNFEWVDTIVYIIENNMEYKDVPHYPKNYRVQIPKKLRKEVWKKRNKTSLKGKCFCCFELIEYDNFQCGHIISVFFRGKTTLSNLEPICSKCNIDMGIKNLNDYKNKLNKSLM